MDFVLMFDKIIALATEIDNIILGVSALICTGAYIKKKIENNELAKVLDKSSLKNEDLHKLAVKEGLTWAAKGIQKLLKK